MVGFSTQSDKRKKLRALFIVFILLLAMTPVLAQEELENPSAKKAAPKPAAIFLAGMAKVDITPDIENGPVYMHGYFGRHKKPATGVLDPLYVKALVVQDQSGGLVGLVSADLLYMHDEIRQLVINKMSRHGFSEHNLLLAGTHTHSGFASYDKRFVATKLFGKFDQRLQDLVVNGTCEALLLALGRMRPAVAEVSFAELESLNRNRRDPAFDIESGTTDDSAIFNTEKYPTDRRLTVLSFRDNDKVPIGVVFNFSAHPTVLSPASPDISADWPGIACSLVEKKIGYGVPVMFFNGSLGDAAPNPDWSEPEQERKELKEYGAQIGKAVITAMENLRPLTGNMVTGRTVRKEFTNLILRSLGKLKMPKSISKIGIRRTDQPLQALRIGEIVFLAVPGEPTTTIGNDLKSNCGGDLKCLIVAPANGYLGYFVTEKEYTEGGYESGSCLFGMPGVNQVRTGIAEAIEQVTNPLRSLLQEKSN